MLFYLLYFIPIDEQEKIDIALQAGENTGQEVIDSLQILQSITPVIHESLHSKVWDIMCSFQHYCIIFLIKTIIFLDRRIAALPRQNYSM